MKTAVVCVIAFCVWGIVFCVLIAFTFNDVTRPAQPLILFGEEGCGLGCWQGLQLGITDAEATQYFAENFPEHHDRYEYEGTVYHTATDIDKFDVWGYMRDNALHAIWLYKGIGAGFDLTLQQVIEELGEPPFSFWDFGLSVDGYSVYPYIILYYPEQGYGFSLDLSHQYRNERTANEVVACSTPYARIRGIYIVHPGTIETVIRDAEYFTNSAWVERIMNNLVTWQGYECRNLSH